MVTGPRVPAKVSVPVVVVRPDQELNDLLGTVESDYVRWRLAKELGVAQQSTYPVLFNFRFPGSKNSTISSVCATSEPNTVMYNVLTDARINFQIDRIVMPKNVRLIDHDGAKVDISKFLTPVNNRIDGRADRSYRPIIDVEVTNDSLIYRLVSKVCDDREDELEDSLKMMSIDKSGEADPFNSSVSSATFDPICNSSPAPHKSLAMFAREHAKAKEKMTAVEVAEDSLEVNQSELDQNFDLSVLSDTPFHGFEEESYPDRPHPYANLSDIVNYMSEPEEESDYELVAKLCEAGYLPEELQVGQPVGSPSSGGLQGLLCLGGHNSVSGGSAHPGGPSGGPPGGHGGPPLHGGPPGDNGGPPPGGNGGPPPGGNGGPPGGNGGPPPQGGPPGGPVGPPGGPVGPPGGPGGQPPQGGPPGGPGGQQAGIPAGQPIGPQPRPQLHPHPDPITNNSNQAERNAAIAALNHDFNNRDIRWIILGGRPQDPGTRPYPNSSYWEKYVDRLLFPQLLTDDEMHTMFGLDHQTFYGLVAEFAVPFLQTGGPQGGTLKPHRMTADSLMALLLLKCQENLSDRLMGALFGEAANTANQWLQGLRNFIYQTDEWLRRGRNLSNIG